MRVLVITNLFPSTAEPGRGLFNLQQLHALARVDEVRVLCPRPGYPGEGTIHQFAISRRAARAPLTNTVDGIRVDYPRYSYVPRLGQIVHDRLFEHGIRRAVNDAVRTFRPQVMYATWSYPDVVAASRLARWHRLPLVAKVHGTDINDYFDRPRRRRLIVAALKSARAVVAVSSALADRLASADIEAARVHVIPNGVDTVRFAPRDRQAARVELGVEGRGPVVLFVGNLKPVKGIDILLRAFATIVRTHANLTLIIIGSGPLRGSLDTLARSLRLGEAVRFLGERSPDEVARWMNAADVLCLPSLAEGMPNVVLEAGASGLPVVATRVGGIPEVVHDGITGFLVPPSDSAALAGALEGALARPWNPDQVSGASSSVSWLENAARLRAVLTDAMKEPVEP